MFYNLKLMQRVVTIVIRNNPDDLAKTFDKGVHLPACLWITWLFITHAVISFGLQRFYF